MTACGASKSMAAEQPLAEGSLRVATFRDTGGNLVGLWTEAVVRQGEPNP